MRTIIKLLIALGRPIIFGLKILKGFRFELGWLVLSIIILLMTVGVVWIYEEVLLDLPNVNGIYKPPRMSTKIMDRKGRVLYKFYSRENRSWVSLAEIPESLVWATIAIEDKEFYKHRGVSVRGLVQAIIYNLFKREEDEGPRGGSTITQQMVKNVFLSAEKSLERKAKEAILAVLVETKLSKDEILERYFNQVAYGGELYGAQEAAVRYFGKNVWEIDMAEAAFLAGLPAAPGSYSPFSGKPEYAILRQKHVVDEMVKAEFISEQKGRDLKERRVKLVDDKRKIEAPHFVFYVKDVLSERYGFEDFSVLGLRVRTSLDLEVFRMAERVVAEEVRKVGSLRISNGAALVIDVKTGDVLAMVGSKDYWADDIDGKFNVTTALRQPGSSIKPINYLLALQKGANLMTMVDDSPVTYDVAGQEPYSPRNYNGRHMGRVSLKMALANSLNVPSVKFLEKNGVNNMIDLAQTMGISSWEDRSRFGLALALGGGEVEMTELAGAYSIFANLGKKIEIDPILEVDNYLGENLFVKEVTADKVVEAKYAFLINLILSDDRARAAIFGLNSKLKIAGKTVAVKTGTTNDLRDNWCIGWTPSRLVAVWVGNNDNSPMSWVASGISGATPIWNRIMSEVLLNRVDEKWKMPEGVYKAKACGKEEYFTDGRENEVDCFFRLKPSPSR